MTRLLIVDPVLLICEAIATSLGVEPDMEVKGLAASADQALDLLATEESCIVLINSSLPNSGALELTELIKREYPAARVIVLGLVDSEPIIMRYIEAGAIGYVLDNESLSDLLQKIRAAAEERALIPPAIAAALIERVASLADRLGDLGVDPDDYDSLTAREKEILELVADGLTNQEIAHQLIIEIGTVKNHVHNILDKLNVNSRQDAGIYLTLIERKTQLNL